MKNVRFAAVAAVLATTFCTASTALAQPSSGGPQPGSNATAVPIDGGASLLLAGGVAYALRRLRGRKVRA